jgi:hypothetical protein
MSSSITEIDAKIDHVKKVSENNLAVRNEADQHRKDRAARAVERDERAQEQLAAMHDDDAILSIESLLNTLNSFGQLPGTYLKILDAVNHALPEVLQNTSHGAEVIFKAFKKVFNDVPESFESEHETFVASLRDREAAETASAERRQLEDDEYYDYCGSEVRGMIRQNARILDRYDYLSKYLWKGAQTARHRYLPGFKIVYEVLVHEFPELGERYALELAETLIKEQQHDNAYREARRNRRGPKARA